ncbi:MAG TPA: hypothetical protein DEQ41_12425, partial [Shewanella sp.]|nr:hypothetical protein [Shewanella sp.]
MPSWQASVLNRLLTYVARPSVSRGSAKVPLSAIRQRLLEMDRRWLSWPQELKVEHWPLSHSPLIHYQLPQPREVSLFYIRGGGFCFKTPPRSEERRGGKEGRYRGAPVDLKTQ